MLERALVVSYVVLCSACWASDAPPQVIDHALGERCGDGAVTGDETCDTAIRRGRRGACPSTCAAADPCSESVLVGEGCRVECVSKPNTAVGPRDGCCPALADARSDADCVPRCGNDVIEAGETCDPPGTCSACVSSNPCTRSVSTGSAESCDLQCHYQPVTECRTSDGCCPAGCSSADDRDCSTPSNDPVTDPDETPDPDPDADAGTDSDSPRDECLAQLGDGACARCQCAKCGGEVASCHGNAKAEERAACANLIECRAASKCAIPECYCGTSTLFTCLTGMADGPCKNELTAAAGSSSLVDIEARASDPSYPLGRANALASCVSRGCSAECAR